MTLEEIERRYRRFAKWTIGLLAAVFVVLLASGVMNIYLLGQNGERSREAKALAVANRQLLATIQQSRRESIRAACEEQNRRNGVAYQFFKALPPSPNQPKRSPAEQEELLRGFTDAVIGRVRNCDRVVQRFAK